MTEVIATREMERRRADGVKSIITVEIGRPAPLPPDHSLAPGYYVPHRCQGVQDDRVYITIHDSSLDALAATLACIPIYLNAYPQCQEIEGWKDLPWWGFPIYPPEMGVNMHQPDK